MIRVKLPFGGITPEQMETFADVVERWVPLNKGHITTRQNIQMHHVPLRDAAALIREISDAGLSSREGCGNTVRNVTADPWAGVCHDELFDPTPYAGAYVRYFVRHPTTQLMPRKVKTAFTGSDTDRALTGIHDVAFIARERDGVKGFEMRVGGGTSIMPRVAPTLIDFVARRRRRVPQVHRGRPAHLRPPGLAARQPRPRPHQGARRQDRHRGAARAGRGGAAGRLGRRARLLDRAPAVPARRGGGRPRSAGRRPARRTATAREFERFRAANVEAQRQEGFSAVQVKVTARRPHARAAPRARRDHARVLRRLRAHDRAPELPAALGARRGGLRRLAPARRARPRRRGRRPGQRRRVVPRHRLLQARHHELDGPQPGRAASGSRRWRSRIR